MAFIDYYKILGVDKNIPQKDVKRAYLKRAKQFHPDLHPDDPKAKAKFQALNEAYEVINDPDKRQKYDRYGEHWREAGDFADGRAQGSTQYGYSYGAGSPFDGFNFSQGGGFSDFFKDLFGTKKTRQRQNTGEVNATVNIDLYTALLGGEVLLQLSNGSRIKMKVRPETQNGTKVRLRGKGHVRGDGTIGDLIVTYNVKLPINLSERQKDLLRQMQQG